MNKQEYQKWEDDARLALSGKYTADEAGIILDWFRNIKGAGERDLIGHDAVEAMLTFVAAQDNFDLYSSLMARLFIYAPLILREDAEYNARKRA